MLLLLKNMFFLHVQIDTDSFCAIQVNMPKKVFQFEKFLKVSDFRGLGQGSVYYLNFLFWGGSVNKVWWTSQLFQSIHCSTMCTECIWLSSEEFIDSSEWTATVSEVLVFFPLWGTCVYHKPAHTSLRACAWPSALSLWLVSHWCWHESSSIVTHMNTHTHKAGILVMWWDRMNVSLQHSGQCVCLSVALYLRECLKASSTLVH